MLVRGGNALRIVGPSRDEKMVHSERPVRAASFTRDGRYLVGVAVDSVTRVWDTGSGRMVLRVLPGSDPVLTTGFTPDGTWVVRSSNDGSAQIFRCIDCNSYEALVRHVRERVKRRLTDAELQRFRPL